MKKTFYSLLFMIILGCLLVSCSDKTNSHLPIRAYVLEESDEIVKPSVTLQENNEFLFSYSALSSYLGFGHYEIDSDIITLKTDDGYNVYIFEIKNETLIFNAEKSSDIPSYASVPDGAVFK